MHGLLRKFPENRKKVVPGETLSFQEFVAVAIKEAIENQIYRRLTDETYEKLDFIRQDEEEEDDDEPRPLSKKGVEKTAEEIRARKGLDRFNFRDISTQENFPIEMQWNEAKSGIFNIVSYPTSAWLSLLNDRNRDLRERIFITKFQ